MDGGWPSHALPATGYASQARVFVFGCFCFLGLLELHNQKMDTKRENNEHEKRSDKPADGYGVVEGQRGCLASPRLASPLEGGKERKTYPREALQILQSQNSRENIAAVGKTSEQGQNEIQRRMKKVFFEMEQGGEIKR